MNLNDFSKYRNQLMGIAIISIMFFHFGNNAHYAVLKGILDPFYYPPFIRILTKLGYAMGSVGVEIFLFLSGMGLYYSFSKNSDIKSFYKKRIIRLIIPYLLIAPIYLFLQDLILFDYGFKIFVLDLLSIQYWFSDWTIYWFVYFILIMYLLYPFIYKLFNVSDTQRYILLILFMILYLPIMYKFSIYAGPELSFSRVPSFILGCAIAKDIKKGKQFKLIPSILFMIGCLFMRILIFIAGLTGIWNRILCIPYCIGFMIFFIFVFKAFHHYHIQTRIINWAGAYSLELYLTHMSFRKVFNFTGYGDYQTLHYIEIIILSILFSYCMKQISNKIQNKIE